MLSPYSSPEAGRTEIDGVIALEGPSYFQSSPPMKKPFIDFLEPSQSTSYGFLFCSCSVVFTTTLSFALDVASEAFALTVLPRALPPYYTTAISSCFAYFAREIRSHPFRVGTRMETTNPTQAETLLHAMQEGVTRRWTAKKKWGIRHSCAPVFFHVSMPYIPWARCIVIRQKKTRHNNRPGTQNT